MKKYFILSQVVAFSIFASTYAEDLLPEVQKPKEEQKQVQRTVAEFKLKELPGYSIRFDFDEKGEATDLLMILPEGSFSLKNLAKRLSESKTTKDKVAPQFDELHDDDITEILLKNENVPLRALLYHFIEEEDYNASKLLLDYNLFLENNKKGNLLTLACSKKEVPVDIIKKLIQKGADVVGTKKSAPIMAAILSMRCDLIDLLIKNGADLNRVVKNTDNKLYSPLDFACSLPASKEKLDIVKFLIHKGAHVKDTEGHNYSVYWAVESQDMPLLKYLLEEGANVNKHPKDTKSSLEIAIEKKNKEMIKLLLQNGANFSN